MTSKPACVVIDSNVLISAGLLPLSKTAQVVTLAVQHFVIAQNDTTWKELETRIARQKFDRYFGPDGRLQHLVKIAQVSQWFEPIAQDKASRDASDDIFVRLAIDAGAKVIISGDKDLTVLKNYQGIAILSPTEFFERFQYAQTTPD
jgi:uncharacterized protein